MGQCASVCSQRLGIHMNRKFSIFSQTAPRCWPGATDLRLQRLHPDGTADRHLHHPHPDADRHSHREHHPEARQRTLRAKVAADHRAGRIDVRSQLSRPTGLPARLQALGGEPSAGPPSATVRAAAQRPAHHRHQGRLHLQHHQLHQGRRSTTPTASPATPSPRFPPQPAKPATAASASKRAAP